MRVLYIVTAYDRQPGDGITPWLVETLRHLRGAGVEVEVLAPAYRGQDSGVVGEVMVHRFRYAPAPWETLTHDQTAPDRVRERPWYLALVPGYVGASALAARALARTGRFDAVHVHWPVPHAVAGLAARRAAGLPLVCTFHGVELTWTRRQLPFLLPFVRHVLRVSDAVTANSTYTASLMRSVHDRPVDRIPFGTTVEVLQHDDRRPPSPPFQLLFVGRLVERKGLQHLLDALPAVRSRHDARLRIVGDGPMRPALEAHAARLGLGDVVRFDGFVPDDVLAGAYRDADLFVLPAAIDAKGDVEGLGVVLIEAAAAGLPVVATDAGGIPDVVRHGETGLLVPAGDPEALVGAISRVLDDPDAARAMGRAARAHVDRAFGWETITRRLVELYERVGRTPST